MIIVGSFEDLIGRYW